MKEYNLLTDKEKQILQQMQKICSKQEKCIFEIKQKIKSCEISESTTEKIIHQLLKEKYINELRYAQAFVSDKLKFNKWGRIKLTYELKQKRIDSITIKEAIADIEDNFYIRILEELLIKKMRTFKNKAPEMIKKLLYKYALQHGFENELISKVIRTIIHQT